MKEAIEIIKKMVEDGHLSQEVAEKYFPELAESEDEKIRKDILDYCIKRQHNQFEALNANRVEDWRKWLERQGKQNPAWSEEDEKKIDFLRNLIRFQIKDSKFSYGWGDDVKYVTKEEAVDMLVSLRPQKKWKPSDKQMELLKEACDQHWEPDGLDPLYTLYQDLKKLREE